MIQKSVRLMNSQISVEYPVKQSSVTAKVPKYYIVVKQAPPTVNHRNTSMVKTWSELAAT